MRPIWSGSIGFGLVNIPVKMYAATEESNLAFVTLDKSNHGKVRYKKVNEETQKEVKEEDIVKSYKMGSAYIVMQDDDFKRAMPEKVDHLEIVQFINEKEIDPVYFEKPYYLEPDKSGVKAYALLRDALKKEGKAALGPLVYHNREWICLVKPLNEFLVLHRLRFFEEIRPVTGLAKPTAELDPAEIKMATQIIQQQTKPFKPESFRDTYADTMLKIIEAKSKGKTAVKTPLKVVHSSTTEDLMKKLKESLNSGKKKAS